MSSALPVDANGKADYKVFADEKAIVIQMPTAPAAGGGDLSV